MDEILIAKYMLLNATCINCRYNIISNTYDVQGYVYINSICNKKYLNSEYDKEMNVCKYWNIKYKNMESK